MVLVLTGFSDVHEAIAYIAKCKQLQPDDLTIPSQRRYASYFKNMLDGVRPSQTPLILKRIIMSEAPKVSSGFFIFLCLNSIMSFCGHILSIFILLVCEGPFETQGSSRTKRWQRIARSCRSAIDGMCPILTNFQRWKTSSHLSCLSPRPTI